MSGRAAVARKPQRLAGLEKVQPARGSASGYPPTVGRSHPNPYHHQFGGGPGYNYPTDEEGLPEASLGHVDSNGRSQASMDDPAYARARRPMLENIESNIEKSALRLALDDKSDQIRQNLGNLFKKKPKDPQERPATSLNNRRDAQEMEGDMRFRTQSRLGQDAWIPGFPVPPSAMPGSPDSESVDAPSFRSQMGNQGISEPPSAPLPPPPEPPSLKCFSGSSPLKAVDFNETEVDREMWLIDGDTLVYLTQETSSGPTGMPSFRLCSKKLRALGSVVLSGLIQENLRNRQSIMAITDSAKSLLTSEHMESTDNLRYTISIAPPPELEGEKLTRWKRGTRNALALLHGKPLIGDFIHEMLLTLQERFIDWIQDEDHAKEIVVTYVVDFGLADVRKCPRAAVGLLAYADAPNVHWEPGYREAFAHCVGMYEQVVTLYEWTMLSGVRPVTKAAIRKAAIILEGCLKFQAQRLRDFNFDGMWDLKPEDSVVAFEAFKSLAGFLRDFYTKSYGSWPPNQVDNTHLWLTRTVVRDLQRDFSALYDYLVDRSVVFRYRLKHLVMDHPTNVHFDANGNGVPMVRVLTNFDESCGYNPIPHPFPLLPPSIPVAASKIAQEKPKRKFFGGGTKKDKKDNAASTEQGEGVPKGNDPMADVKFKLAYEQANNLLILHEYTGNALVEAFIRHEQFERICEVDPLECRLGRWVLIYFMLQTLASISSDVPGLIYPDGVGYFLNGFIETPSWKQGDFMQASPFLTHCFTVEKTWVKSDETENQAVAENHQSAGEHYPQAAEQYSQIDEHHPQVADHYASGVSAAPSGAFRSEHSGYSVRSPTLTNNSQYGHPSDEDYNRFVRDYGQLDLDENDHNGYAFGQTSHTPLPQRMDSRFNQEAYAQRPLPRQPSQPNYRVAAQANQLQPRQDSSKADLGWERDATPLRQENLRDEDDFQLFQSQPPPYQGLARNGRQQIEPHQQLSAQPSFHDFQHARAGRGNGTRARRYDVQDIPKFASPPRNHGRAMSPDTFTPPQFGPKSPLRAPDSYNKPMQGGQRQENFNDWDVETGNGTLP
ncbi:uncharacterized protein LY89DRAFT_787893 [Mollisia scopiformis]|uniref:DUF8004 domain-containing protein n=1 Tax=Mollisia scopiformis TaxID=149040 RepID=A0A132BC64_MOLSC|nr:uncharacterized protein LY89DRAFT_787893 [Mollisia scopiformis]KUJ09599.1 hypothetical protein LY89DRAFT_787893 [Mollisia scopiformis]